MLSSMALEKKKNHRAILNETVIRTWKISEDFPATPVLACTILPIVSLPSPKTLRESPRPELSPLPPSSKTVCWRTAILQQQKQPSFAAKAERPAQQVHSLLYNPEKPKKEKKVNCELRINPKRFVVMVSLWWLLGVLWKPLRMTWSLRDAFRRQFCH